MKVAYMLVHDGSAWQAEVWEVPSGKTLFVSPWYAVKNMVLRDVLGFLKSLGA